MTYNVFSGTLNPTESVSEHTHIYCACFVQGNATCWHFVLVQVASRRGGQRWSHSAQSASWFQHSRLRCSRPCELDRQHTLHVSQPKPALPQHGIPEWSVASLRSSNIQWAAANVWQFECVNAVKFVSVSSRCLLMLHTSALRCSPCIILLHIISICLTLFGSPVINVIFVNIRQTIMYILLQLFVYWFIACFAIV